MGCASSTPVQDEGNQNPQQDANLEQNANLEKEQRQDEAQLVVEGSKKDTSHHVSEQYQEKIAPDRNKPDDQDHVISPASPVDVELPMSEQSFEKGIKIYFRSNWNESILSRAAIIVCKLHSIEYEIRDDERDEDILRIQNKDFSISRMSLLRVLDEHIFKAKGNVHSRQTVQQEQCLQWVASRLLQVIETVTMRNFSYSPSTSRELQDLAMKGLNDLLDSFDLFLSLSSGSFIGGETLCSADVVAVLALSVFQTLACPCRKSSSRAWLTACKDAIESLNFQEDLRPVLFLHEPLSRESLSIWMWLSQHESKMVSEKVLVLLLESGSENDNRSSASIALLNVPDSVLRNPRDATLVLARDRIVFQTPSILRYLHSLLVPGGYDALQDQNICLVERLMMPALEDLLDTTSSSLEVQAFSLQCCVNSVGKLSADIDPKNDLSVVFMAAILDKLSRDRSLDYVFRPIYNKIDAMQYFVQTSFGKLSASLHISSPPHKGGTSAILLLHQLLNVPLRIHECKIYREDKKLTYRDGDVVLHQVPSILRYLITKWRRRGTGRLYMPSTDLERASEDQTLVWINSKFSSVINELKISNEDESSPAPSSIASTRQQLCFDALYKNTELQPRGFEADTSASDKLLLGITDLYLFSLLLQNPAMDSSLNANNQKMLQVWFHNTEKHLAQIVAMSPS